MSGVKEKTSILASYGCTFALAGFVPVLFFCLTFAAPMLPWFYFSVWAAGFSLDVYTTYRLHRRFPGGMEKYETCGYMRLLYRVFGFWKGVLAYAVLVEAPLVALVAFALIPGAQDAFSPLIPSSRNFAASLASSMCFFGLIHLSAVPANLKFKLPEAPRGFESQ